MARTSAPDQNSFARAAETFGYDTEKPWAQDAFRLLFKVPRAFQPLVDAWEERHPGTKKALAKLVAAGFVSYQGPVIVDTRTGKMADAPSRAVRRWRTTAKGKRRLDEFKTDTRVLEESYQKVHKAHIAQTIALLDAFDLDDSHARFGISAPHAVSLAGMEERLGRWWVKRWSEEGLIVSLDEKLPDTREVIPAHYRVTKVLCKQLQKVCISFNKAEVSTELALSRSNFLDDIEPARLGLTGATDYDHDVDTQRVVAALLRSPKWAQGGVFTMEPKLRLPVEHIPNSRTRVFSPNASQVSFYQPDAELRGNDEVDGRQVVRRIIVEYERFQSRRDAWSHIEKLLGYLHARCLPFEHAVLLFVVNSDQRRRTYVELIEAFCDHLIENPQYNVANKVTLAVSSTERVVAAQDPLNLNTWNRIILPSAPQGTVCTPVLHDDSSTPYDLYFGRTR